MCVSVCQIMGAPTAAPIVTWSADAIHITSSKAITSHLRSEAVLRPKLRLHLLHAVSVCISSYPWQEEGREKGQ